MLSGGNIQKMAVARELTSHTKLIVCDQPTRGIDVGATEAIRKRILQMRDEDNGVLLVSADLGGDNEPFRQADSNVRRRDSCIVP